MALENPEELALLKKLMKRAKYGNRKVVHNGQKFDSTKELRRYIDLQMLEDTGAIEDLKRQVRFKLKVKGFPVCVYVADFVYRRAGKKIVEDVKGFKTDKYRLKKKLMWAVHKIAIVEI